MMKFLLAVVCCAVAYAQIPDLKMPDTGTGAAPAPAKAAPSETPAPAIDAPFEVAPKPGMPPALEKADLSLEQVLEKARAFVGKEADLQAVNSLDYTGRVFDANGKEIALFRYIYQKPYFFRRQETNRSNNFKLLCKDDFEAWIFSGNVDGPVQRAPMPFANQDFERNLAVDRLNFFKGPSALERSEVKLDGIAQWESRRAYKLDYTYPVGLGKMTMTRYIDAETGRSLALVSNHGKTQAVDSGVIEADGLKFPKYTSIYQDGKLTLRLAYEKIAVNQTYPPEIFNKP